MKKNKITNADEKISQFELADSVFDWDGLLHRLMGDEELAKEIIDDFLKQIPENLSTIKNAFDDQNLMRIKSEAHMIKGASGNVGALNMQKIAEQIEIACEDENLERAGSFISEFDTQIKILKNTLTQLKD